MAGADLERMYLALFNKITDVLRYLERGELVRAICLLEEAQGEGEPIYIESGLRQEETDADT